jgi:hypothetical protein
MFLASQQKNLQDLKQTNSGYEKLTRSFSNTAGRMKLHGVDFSASYSQALEL